MTVKWNYLNANNKQVVAYKTEKSISFFSKEGAKIQCYDVKNAEYNRFKKECSFPITTSMGTKIWLDENSHYHRIDGPAVISYNNVKTYYIHGKHIDEKDFRKTVYFFAQKIKLLQKLLEIPEIWDEVYYSHKNDFISLMRKI